MAGNLVRFVIEADARSATRVLSQLSEDSQKTGRQIKKDADESSASFDRMGRSAIRLRESVRGLASMIGLGGLAFGLKDAVQGGMQLQASQAQLQQALNQTGQSAGNAFSKLKDYAESLSTHGGFGTPQNVQALTAFVRETHSATQSQNMLALATNIARGRNMDLASAQTVVQRAYTGSIGRLQQLLGPMVAAKEAAYGLSQAHAEQVLQLERQAKLMGKAGPQWLAQQKVYAALTPQMRALTTLQNKSSTAQQILGAASVVFGGATGAYSQTTQGKISNLQDSLKNLTDTIGIKLLPVVNRLAQYGVVLVNAFAKLPGPVQAGVLGLTALSLITAPLRSGLKFVADMAKFAGNQEWIFGNKSIAAAEKEAAAGVLAERAAGAEVIGGAGSAAAGAAGAAGGASLLSRLGGGLLRGGLAVGGGALLASTLRSMTGIGNVHGKSNGLASLIGTGVGAGTGGLLSLLFPPAAPFLISGGAAVGNLAGGAWSGIKHFLGFNAMGGTIGNSGLTMVGEQGPELLRLPIGTQVVPNSGLGGYSNTGGQVIVLHHITKLDSRVLAESVARYALNRAARGPTSFVGGSLVTGQTGLA